MFLASNNAVRHHLLQRDAAYFPKSAYIKRTALFINHPVKVKRHSKVTPVQNSYYILIFYLVL